MVVLIPVVPHEAVAEVSKIGSHRKPVGEARCYRWQSEPIDGPKGGLELCFLEWFP